MSTSIDSKALFDMQTTPSIFLHYHDLIESFVGGDRNIRSDLIFSHPSVVGFLYVDDGILQKVFLPTNISNFRDRLKTSVVAVCGSCSSPTPIKINHRNLFSDVYHFSSGDYHNLFPSVDDGGLLQNVYCVSSGTYPDLPGGLAFNYCLMLSIS